MKHYLLSGLLCASALLAINSNEANAQGTIYTVAGTGIAGYGGDGGPAALAVFSSPYGVATDGAGNIYVADYGNHVVRMIAAGGTVSTVAGNGSFGYAGMGGSALSAGMEYPNSVFADAAGNFYMTDFFADCAYGVNSISGHITNICGHNSQGRTGDGGDAPLATMELPKQVWKDAAGNTYLADYGNNRVRVVNGAAGNVSTLTGGGAHGFSPDGTPAGSCKWGGITGVCADGYGNVYVSDGSNHVVREIVASTGTVKTIAGTGISGYSGDGSSAINATLRSPGNLFLNSAGYLFICDGSSNVVRVMNVFVPAGIIKTLAGNGTMGFSGDGNLATTAQLNQPSGVWESGSGIIYIADMGNQRIRAIMHSGYKTEEAGTQTKALSDVVIFPNPSSGTFSIIGSSLPENTTVEVYDMLGVKVYTQTISQQHATINLDEPSGIYNVVLKSAGAIANERIVINK